MGLGPGEIVLILFIAYVVVGPEDMGKLARMLARALRELRKLSTDLRGEAEGVVPGILPEGKNARDLSDLRTAAEKSLGLAELQKEMDKGLDLSRSGQDTQVSASLSWAKTEKQAAADLESVLGEIQKAEERIS